MKNITILILSLTLAACGGSGSNSSKKKGTPAESEMSKEELAKASEFERSNYITAQVSRAVDSLEGAGCDFGVRAVTQGDCMFNLSEFYGKQTAEQAKLEGVTTLQSLNSLNKTITNKRVTHSENKKFIAFYALNNIRKDAVKYCVNGGLNKKLISFLEMNSNLYVELGRIDREMKAIVNSIRAGTSLEAAKTRWKAFRAGTFSESSIAMLNGDMSAFFEARLAVSKLQGHSKDIYSVLPSRDQMEMSTRVIWDFESRLEMIANRPTDDNRLNMVIGNLEMLDKALKEGNIGYAILQLRETKVARISVINHALDLMDNFQIDEQCFGFNCVSEAKKIKNEVLPCAD